MRRAPRLVSRGVGRCHRALRAVVKVVQAVGAKARMGLVGASLVSRTPTAPGNEPTSTQPFSPWLWLDLCQLVAVARAVVAS
jgi:hypothetical protein